MRIIQMLKTTSSLIKRSVFALAVALAVAGTPGFAADNIISNGSFEVGKAMDLGGNTYASVSLPGTDLPGWDGNFTSWYVYAPGWGFAAQDGTNVVNLIGVTGTDALSQTFAVTGGTKYVVSYYNRQRGGGGQAVVDLSVSGGAVSGAKVWGTTTTQPASSSIQQVTTLDGDWTHYGFTFTPDTTGTATLTLGNYYDGATYGDNDGVFVDNVSVTEAELLSNGSFEIGDPAPPTDSGQIQVAAGDTANLPGWTASTDMGWYFKYAAWGMTAPVGAGERLFNLNGDTGLTTLSQSFAVLAGVEYTVSYSEMKRGGGGQMNATLGVLAGTVTGAGGTPVAVEAGPAASIVQTTAINDDWTSHSFRFTPSDTTTATITLGNKYDGGIGDNDGIFVDKVSVTIGGPGLTMTTTTLDRHTGTVTPSTYGDTLIFDVTVTGSTPSGTVTLKDGGAGGTTIGSGTLSGGTCTITNTTLAVGTHANIVAVYGGDGNNNPSTSSALDPAQVVNPGAPVKLAFTTQPGGGQPGAVLEPQPVVTVQDAFGNTVNSSTSIALAITAGTPTSGGPGTLSGTKTVAAVSGVATFTNLSIDLAGVGYKLTATSDSLTSADSTAFKVEANLISNGSFEVGKYIADPSNQGPPTYAAGYTSVSLPGTDLPGWFGSFLAWYCRAPGNGTGMGAAQDGERAVNLNGGTGTAVLSQSFAVTAGAVYTVSYYEKIRGNGFMDATLSVAAGTVTGTNGTPVAVSTGPAASIVQTTGVNADWTLHSFTFTPDTTTTATLTFGNDYVESDHGDNDGVFLDNVSVTLVSNPSVGPTADFTGGPTSGTLPPGLTVTFTNTSTKGSATITNCFWDFGDGGTTNADPAAIVSHAYAATGTFSVILLVADTNGLSGSVTNENMISVTPRPPVTPPEMLSGRSGFYLDPATGHATVKFTAQDGVQYTLEYKDDLLATDPGWQPCCEPITTNGTPQIMLQDTNDTHTVTQRYYRIEAQYP